MKKKAAVAKKPSKSKSSAPVKRRAGRTEGPSAQKLDSILNEVTGGEKVKDEDKRLEHFGVVQCPYCGESFEIHIEAAEDGMSMYEDCHVCCKPISINIHVEDDQVQVSAYRS